MHRWATAGLVVLALLDAMVLVLGFRASNGNLPPFQNEAAPLTIVVVSPDATPSPGTGEEDAVTGPLLLGANAAGDALRATRGACEAQFNNPARVWVANIDSGLIEEVEVPGLLEALGLMVYADGTFRISGLDEKCDPLTFESDDVGATWSPTETAAIWRLNADTTSTSVDGPRGNVPIDCPAHQLLNLPDRRAIASCESTSFFSLRPDADPTLLSVDGLAQLSIAPGSAVGRYYAFGATERCDAQVGEFTAESSSLAPLACLHEQEIGSRAPLAIATSAERVIVQVGNDLMVSSDGGASFVNVGDESLG